MKEEINKYYIDMAGIITRPITKFYNVIPNLFYKEFNSYINCLDEESMKKTYCCAS